VDSTFGFDAKAFVTRGKLLVSNRRGLEAMETPKDRYGCSDIDFSVNRFVL